VSGPQIVDARDRDALVPLYTGGWDPGSEIVEGVRAILAGVRESGDPVLVELTRRFDDPAFTLERLRVEIPSPQAARRLVPSEVAEGLTLARERVASFHEKQRAADVAYVESDGTRYELVTHPLRAVGAYVPSGTAPLPSSAIMTVVPAKLAGVERVAVASPPSAKTGQVNPAVVFACALCGADELYAVGGAQAIAAFAFGTQTIARVDKIVGPGNVWVTEAKRQVLGSVGIDGLAGPSEVLVVADASSRAEYVAGEMLAQAEHDPRARVAAVSTDRAILERVADVLAGARAVAGRDEIVAQVLAKRAYLIHAHDDEEVLEVIERFAPEHLSIQTQAPHALAERVRCAGAIFIGPETPVAAGDYIAGTNHVLPTAGAARFASGLRLADFTRTTAIVENSAQRMRSDAPVLERLALFEGLPGHARTARMRA